jgi:hypothetical protein
MMMLASMLGLKPDELFATAKEMQEKFAQFVEAAQRIDKAQQANAESLALLHRKIDSLYLWQNLKEEGMLPEPTRLKSDGALTHGK